MCGIAGIVDIEGNRPVAEDALRAMARAITHRGPDEEGFFIRPGIGLASRRLSIVGLADGQQPVSSEDGNIHAIFNGEFFDHLEQRAALEARGHRLAKSTDTEILPHLWEEHGEGMWEKLRGQFAVAIWDERRRALSLGRDRFGIAPLYWTRRNGWLLFASEIKALLASGLVPAQPDLRGIDHVFTFSAMPGPRTCFEGIQLLGAGKFLRVANGEVTERAFWQMDFPDAGDELDSEDPKPLVEELDRVLTAAVEERLRADVPVGSYLSGGVDSSMILALATKLRGPDVNTYTVQVKSPELDELDAATHIARHIGAKAPVVQPFSAEDAVTTYPELIRAAEAPVIDTSCAALMQLAKRVNGNGQKVVLTGEGADEWLVGYPWYKAAKVVDALDAFPGVRLGELAKRGFLRLNKVPQYSRAFRRRTEEAVGGANAWIDAYGLLGLSKLRFYGEAMREVRDNSHPWAELGMPLERARRWSPLNRGVWVAARVTLGGMLLQVKGDRVAMNSSVEVRYPFLDEDVFDFTAKLHPRWKLRGLKRDKHLLRLLAERYLPEEVYSRGKVIFRAPLDGFHADPEPEFMRQLLSEESLRKTGYFEVAEVQRWRKEFRTLKAGGLPRLSVEMGLTAVVATQLWHHTWIGGGLADV